MSHMETSRLQDMKEDRPHQIGKSLMIESTIAMVHSRSMRDRMILETDRGPNI